jgi:hypothetical protein
MSQNPFSDPYASPQPSPSLVLASGQKPGVWFWYVGYCLIMAFIYLACFAFSIALILTANEESPENYFVGFLLLIISLPLLLLFAIAPFLPRNKYTWFLGFLTIGIGFTSCVTLPASIALIIQWIKPQVKAYLNVQ